ncbi:uncharacterized protein LOC116300522 [Actinia tenebrosa]|uniref:Uncharacterized protein LOC116300522 n=1 Tax=Actinia tenebrosa TaxID=6105 RepID=A0A6P8IAR2_ACTTE|nr:uncharacterized protein LOC116300522 [Actinia tenebrosa]
MMKAIAILIVLAGTFACIQAALPNVGTCNYENYNNKIRTCITQFIKVCQENPNGKCSIYYDSFIDCSAKSAISCFPSLLIDQMKASLKQIIPEEYMCEKAGLQAPDLSQIKVTIPCDISLSEYQNKINKCSDNFVKKWSANRADSTLCREYLNVKNCVKNTIHKYCQLKGDIQEAFDYQFDNYNPFCPKSVDPGSKVSSIAVSKVAIVISLVAAAIQAL